MKPEQILEFLNQKLKPRVDVIPEGWFTIQQLSRAWGSSDVTTGKKVRSAVVAGLMDKQMFVISNSNGTTRPVAHYRIKG